MNAAGDRARWREILLYQAYCHLRVESERLYIGYLWWALEPLLEMGLLYLVFRHLTGSHIEHYLAFLLTGLVAWRWLAQSLLRAAPALLQNQGLFLQVFVPKLVFPAAVVLADLTRFAVGVAVLLGFLCVDGLGPAASWVALPLVLGTQFLLLAALALWLAALVPFLRTLLVGLDVALRFGMLASGVFFDMQALPGTARALLSLNPMVAILAAWRDVLVQQRWPEPMPLAVIAAASLLAIAAARTFVARRELLYPRLPA